MRKMIGRTLTSSALLLLIFTEAQGASQAGISSAEVTYPKTRRVDVVDDYFGVKVSDPYRWLENDVRDDKEVAAWIDAQNNITQSYLATLPARDVFRNRLKQLFNFERLGIPVKKGGRYFYMRNTGLQNQSVLYVSDSIDKPGRALIDPNGWSQDGATALADWGVSGDGKLVGYTVQDGGGDQRTIRLLDVDSGKLLADEVKFAQFTSIEWMKDRSGFFYTRFPETASFQAAVGGHSVYFHRLGTSQAQDRLVYADLKDPKLLHFISISEDGRYLTINSDNGSMAPKLGVVDLASKDWTFRQVAPDYNHWKVAGNIGSKFYIVTSRDAGRFKLVTMDVAAVDPVTTDLVSEQDAILRSAKLVGGKLLLTYMVDVKSEIRRYTLDGKPDGIVKLPGIGTTSDIDGGRDDAETFFAFSSYNVPTAIYRYDAVVNTARVWAKPKIAADLDKIVVEQRFYSSKDGTRVPMFIVRRRDVTGPAPTILFGYGGYFLMYPPTFSPDTLAWVEQGGVYAVAHIRGGAEYGIPWHHAGRLDKKQNVFDDFIAAAEYLKAQNITPPKGLAIKGGSNGGLLVTAVVNQRPNLIDVALPTVPVTEMVRFDKFTFAKYWATEYGSPGVEANFRLLYKISPYHNVRSGVNYPAILATTADTDDRVVPGHSFKYTAALQAADIGPKPHLVRIETRAGHGSGKPIDKAVEETADLWAFAARWTGLKISTARAISDFREQD
jgi:prolyl oligopeptidase